MTEHTPNEPAMCAPNLPIASETLTTPAEAIPIATARFSCDGGKGAQGHPRVYLTLNSLTPTVCPYCSKVFIAAGTSHS